MENGKLKIKFEFTNEFGSTYVQESSFDSMPEYESDMEKMGRLFNIFLKQIGYCREEDCMFMESLSEDELEAMDNFLYEYRECGGFVKPYEPEYVFLVKSEDGSRCGLYIDNSLRIEGHSVSLKEVISILGDRTNIVLNEITVSNEEAENFPRNIWDFEKHKKILERIGL